MKDKLKKRLIALVLAITMILGMIPSEMMKSLAATDLSINTSVGSMMVLTSITVKNVDGAIEESSANKAKIQLNSVCEEIELTLNGTKKGGPANMPLNATMKYSINGGSTMGFTANGQTSGFANVKLTPEWNADGIYAAEIKISEPGGGGTYTLEFEAPISSGTSVKTISLNKNEDSVFVGDTTKLVASVLPKEANQKVEWTSLDTSIATVDSEGNITAKKAGTVIIRATTKGKDAEGKVLTANCKVTVNNVSVTDISLEKTAVEIPVGYTEILKATVSPQNATIKEIEWTSSDTSIATVDQNGKVAGVTAGTAIITAKSVDNPTVSKSCTVTIKYIDVENVKLGADSIEVNIGYSKNLAACVEPDNATVNDIEWSSSDTSVATVDKNGKVTGLKKGTAIITAKSVDNPSKYANCTVKVNKVAVTGITLDKTELDLYVRDEVTLKATLIPSEATEKRLVWNSSNESIATVDSNGVVKGIKEGEAVITVESVENANLKASCLVNVAVLLETDIKTTCVSAGNYDTWLSNINVKGGDVAKYFWNIEEGHTEKDTHVLYVQLSENTANDAKLNLAYTLKHTKDSRKGSISAPTEVQLEDGQGTVVAKTTSYSNNWRGVARTYEIHFTNKANNTPIVKEGAVTEVVKSIGETFEINLDEIFVDKDGTALKYFIVNNDNRKSIDAQFSLVVSEQEDTDYTFIAEDIWGATVSHKITVKVLATETVDIDVVFPEDITPTFYITKEFLEGIDVLGKELETVKRETKDGFTKYIVSVPENLERVSVRDENWGGMTFCTKDSNGNSITDAIRFVKVETELLDVSNNLVDGSVVVLYGDCNAVKGTNGYLLCTDIDYTYKALPNDTTTYITGIKTEVLVSETTLCTVTVEIPLNNPVTITAPTGSEAELYLYKQYYSNTKYERFGVKDNGDGTSTTYFINAKIPSGGGTFIYRVKYEDYAVKAGWTTTNVTVTFDENDPKSDARVNYSTSDAKNKDVTEDNVLLNINGQNNLVLSIGQSKTLKAYRAWEIIPISYNNNIITPDFHYDVISGKDVVKLTDKASLSTTDTDWKTIKALKSGTAIIEVSYDAINVSGNSNQWSGIYGATDPARTGLMVVQVGNHADVNFGIKGKSSQGSLDYTKGTAKAWDAEFDTLYFIGTNGELELSPTVNEGTVQKVQVSSNKGNSWKTLSEKNGVYTAPIAHGNNIIRVITDNGEAYQVVRGYKVNVSYKITNDNGNGVVDAGETVRVIFDQIHQPIPKMAGNYNPGYRGNTNGDSATHIRYTFNGELIEGAKVQYTVPSSGNYIDVTIPADTAETSFILSDGYMATGVIGLTAFADGGDSHRNIPDGGCSTRGSITTFHTRSMLPDITINIGDQSAPNSAPYVKGDAIKSAQIEQGQTYALNPETLFDDADKDALTFTYSVNGEEQGATDKTFTLKPGATGEYKITFVASDGKLSATHTMTLNVVNASQKDTTIKFDIAPSKIKGYVTVGFEDFGVRDENAYGLKYPVQLGVIIPDTKVPFAEGDTIAEVTIRLLDAMGIGYEYSGSVTSGFYLAAIKNFVVNGTPYDSMAQFDAGEGSGWMIASNDWFIDKGASEFTVKAGDEIQWKYTCQLGSDIGDNSWEKVVEKVEKLIEEIGLPITIDSIDKITAARNAYNELSDFYQSKVSNYNDLLAAEKTLETLINENATAEDREAAAKVDQLIDAIGTVTLESAQQIDAAREAYNNLTSLQKQLVTKLEELETAENQLKQLSSTSHEEIYRVTGEYISALGAPTVGSIGGEWMVIGLSRGNQGFVEDDADAYFNQVVKYMNSKFEGNPELEKEVRLHGSKSTDNARVILGLTAAGFDATNVNGYNLFKGLDDMEYLKYQGVNGPMWALIALNSHPSYKDEFETITEEDLINEILSAQLADSGWDLLGVSADTDMTAMAIQALAPYYDVDEKVKDALDRALEKLSAMQQNDGSFASVDGANSESTAQVIVALTALGINPEEDSRFIKKGMSAVDALCNYAVEGGGFMHTPNGKLDGMATEQGYYALVSYFRLLNSQTSLYDMQDVTLRIGEYLEKEDDSKTDSDSEAVEKEETVKEDSKEKVKEESKEEIKENIEEDLTEDFVESVPEEETISTGVTEQDNSVAFIWCAIAAAGIFALVVLIVIRRRMEESK